MRVTAVRCCTLHVHFLRKSTPVTLAYKKIEFQIFDLFLFVYISFERTSTLDLFCRLNWIHSTYNYL